MPTVERAMKALNAVVFPMKIKERRAWRVAARMMARTGTPHRGDTWAKNLGKGIPLSRAKAHVVRELEARKSSVSWGCLRWLGIPVVATVAIVVIIQLRAIPPALFPVTLTNS